MYGHIRCVYLAGKSPDIRSYTVCVCVCYIRIWQPYKWHSDSMSKITRWCTILKWQSESMSENGIVTNGIVIPWVKFAGVKRVSGVVKLSRKYKLDCVDLQGRSREGKKKRALENGNKKHKNYRVEIWAGGSFLWFHEWNLLVYNPQTSKLNPVQAP